MAAGWFASGKTLGVALDLDSGTMHVSVDGGDWAVAFQDECAPSATAGAALFPALSGKSGARVVCNWGADRPLKHTPPSGEYVALGQASKVLLLLLLFMPSFFFTPRCLLPCLPICPRASRLGDCRHGMAAWRLPCDVRRAWLQAGAGASEEHTLATAAACKVRTRLTRGKGSAPSPTCMHAGEHGPRHAARTSPARLPGG